MGLLLLLLALRVVVKIEELLDEAAVQFEVGTAWGIAVALAVLVILGKATPLLVTSLDELTADSAAQQHIAV